MKELIIKLLLCIFFLEEFLEVINFKNSKQKLGGLSGAPYLRKSLHYKFLK